MFLRLSFLLFLSFFIFACSNNLEKTEAPAVAPKSPASVAPKPAAKRRMVKGSPSLAYAASGSTGVGTTASTSKPKLVGRGASYRPQAGILTAGEIDDNLNLAAFKRYVHNIKKKNKKFNNYPTVTSHNVVRIQVVDSTGRGVSNARLKIGGRPYYTRTDGFFYFYPSYESPKLNSRTFPVALMSSNPNSSHVIKEALIDTRARGVYKIVLKGEQNTLPKALDLMFVIDTTGSMGDELRYIKSELKGIINRVKQIHPETSIRYGLVVYRDTGDQYVVRSYSFQNSLAKMETLLAKQNAAGGGDYPEALDAAVEKAVRANWGTGNRARLMFLIADAPPHSRNVGKALQAAKIAHQKGIRIYPVGASGVADEAEFVMRNMAIISNGRYQFLTDDSGVGNSHQEPHVACYVVTRLNQLITRTISSELSGRRVEPTKSEMIRRVGKYDNGICHPSEYKTN